MASSRSKESNDLLKSLKRQVKGQAGKAVPSHMIKKTSNKFIKVTQAKQSSQSLTKMSAASSTPPLSTDSDIKSSEALSQIPEAQMVRNTSQGGTRNNKVLFEVPSIDEKDSSSSDSLSQSNTVGKEDAAGSQS